MQNEIDYGLAVETTVLPVQVGGDLSPPPSGAMVGGALPTAVEQQNANKAAKSGLSRLQKTAQQHKFTAVGAVFLPYSTAVLTTGPAAFWEDEGVKAALARLSNNAEVRSVNDDEEYTFVTTAPIPATQSIEEFWQQSQSTLKSLHHDVKRATLARILSAITTKLGAFKTHEIPDWWLFQDKHVKGNMVQAFGVTCENMENMQWKRQPSKYKSIKGLTRAIEAIVAAEKQSGAMTLDQQVLAQMNEEASAAGSSRGLKRTLTGHNGPDADEVIESEIQEDVLDQSEHTGHVEENADDQGEHTGADEHDVQVQHEESLGDPHQHGHLHHHHHHHDDSGLTL